MGALAVLTALFLGCGAVFAAAFLDGGFDGIDQALAGELAVHGLGAGVLDGDGDICVAKPERDGGGDFVHMLAAGAGGAAELLLEISLGDAQAVHAALEGGLLRWRRFVHDSNYPIPPSNIARGIIVLANG